jgi:hypothetical protein
MGDPIFWLIFAVPAAAAWVWIYMAEDARQRNRHNIQRAVRNEVIEQCAKVVEAESCGECDFQTIYASRIRALKTG